MENLKAIVGDNYFTNANREKGTCQLLQDNASDINGNSYLASVFAKSIKDNCLVDFQRIVNQSGQKLDLLDNIKI